VKSFGNLVFSCMVMIYFLAHNKDYEIACLINPRSEELKLLLLHFVFARLCIIGLY
jgi:hypothetical protein